MTLPVEAQPLDPTEVVVEGSTEIRPCGVCRLRLVVPTAALGRMTACPKCGTVARALATGGPFGELTATPPPRPERPPTADELPLAPVVPYRPLDPFDDRSPMVDAVATMQWVSAACITVVTVFNLGMRLRREYATNSGDVEFLAAVMLEVLIAGVLTVVGFGLRVRWRAAWLAALAVSAWVVWGVGGYLVLRANRQAGQAGWFDFGILVSLPSLLIALITLVVLLTPRYRWEFRRQTG